MELRRRRRRRRESVVIISCRCLLIVILLFVDDFRSSCIAVDGSDVNVPPILYFTEEPNGTIYGSQDSTVCMNCSAKGTIKGAVEVTWRKDGRAIDKNSRRYSVSNSSLCIEHLSVSSHEGFYECLAHHQKGTLVSSKFKLEVARISSVSVEPVNISAYEGESIRFLCVVNATPWPDIEWLRNDQKLINNDNRVTVLKSGVLQLVNITKVDEGQYRCVAGNAWANGSSPPATLSIVSSNSSDHSVTEALLGNPQDMIVIQSHTVVIECFLNGQPPPAVTWTKQGSEIRKDAVLHGNGNLEISDVSESDSGIYLCGWTNSGDGQSRTVQANITVYVPPRLLQNRSMKPYTLKRREQVVRLNCQFSGRPEPTITWFKDGKIVKTSNRIKVDRFELSILQTTASDEGIYQCRAENPAGVQQVATQLKFQLNENAPFPPVGLVASAINTTSVLLSWRDSPQNEDRGVRAYSVHLIPPVGLEHQYVVPCQRKQCGGSLKVEVLRPYTNYTVYVVAYNMQGSSKQSRKVAITTAEDVPTRFPSLILFPLSMTSIQLNWKELSPDHARGVITEYRIKYQKLGAQKYREISERPPSTEYILTGLDPNTKYSVVVAARTKVGYPSMSSESLMWKTCVTKDFNQSDAVLDTPVMTVAAVGNTAILVNWTNRNPRIRVLGYDLVCQSNSTVHKGQMDHRVTLSYNVSQHLFTFLEPSTIYQVTLVAFNSKDKSQPVTQSVFTSNPSAVEVQVINSTAVLVHWKRPTQTAVYKYTIRYCSLTAATANKSVLSSLTESLIVGDLIPFTMYEFTVEARGSEVIHLGTTKCQTSEGVPSAPSDLDVTLLGDGSVLVHWNPPLKQNGLVIKYFVLYTADRDWTNAYWFSKMENGTSLSSVVQNLRLGVVYYFRVQAVTNAGRGPSSEVVHVSTSESVSDPEALTDQELGIIIGTAIGVTCIVVCVCIIVLHNRCRGQAAAVPIASVEGHMTNGTVAHCHCQPSTYSAEFHVLRSRADGLSFLDNSHQLIENSNCDSKGGNVQSSRDRRYVDHNNTLPLLQDGYERADNDLDGIDYDDDPIVILNNAINSAYGGDKSKACESENLLHKVISNDTILCQNSLLGGRLPSRNCDHATVELADEKEPTDDGKESEDSEASSHQENNFDGEHVQA